MELVLSMITGVLFASGIYLMLERHILRILFGFILLGNGVNLAVLTAGRLSKKGVPIILQGELVLEPPFANPLSQALVLTAIVIGFGVLIFCLSLAYRAVKDLGLADPDQMNLSEKGE